MSRDEFVAYVVSHGYSTKEKVEKHVSEHPKDKYEWSDLLEVHRENREDRLDNSSKVRGPKGGSSQRESLGSGNYKKNNYMYDENWTRVKI